MGQCEIYFYIRSYETTRFKCDIVTHNWQSKRDLTMKDSICNSCDHLNPSLNEVTSFLHDKSKHHRGLLGPRVTNITHFLARNVAWPNDPRPVIW